MTAVTESDSYEPAAESTIEQAFHLILDDPLSVYLYAMILMLVTILSINLPAKLINNDTVSRPVVHLMTTVICAMAGVMLGTAAFTLLPSALETNSSIHINDPNSDDASISHRSKHHTFYVCMAFVIGLLNVPVFERSFIYIATKISNKLSIYRSANEPTDYDESSAFLHHKRPATIGVSGRQSASQSMNQPINQSINKTVGQPAGQPLLPVPDYRRSRDLTQDDPDDFVTFDLNDRDQLSPPLGSSRFRQSNNQSTNQTNYQSLYQPPHEHIQIDAHSFLETQKYLARCAFCKDKIHTRKGLAYHSAGCELVNAHAFDLNASFWASMRGQRGEIAMRHSLTRMFDLYIAAFNQAINVSIMALAFANFSGLTIVSSICYLLSLMCYQSFLGLALGVGFQQNRCRWLNQFLTSLCLAVVGSSSLILAGCLSHNQSINQSNVMLVSSLARAYSAGSLIWVCLVDCLIEEMERRDARATKWPAFVICTLGTALVHLIE